MTKALTNRLNILKEVKEIRTQNYVVVQSYRKLERLGFCSVIPETEISDNRFIYLISLK